MYRKKNTHCFTCVTKLDKSFNVDMNGFVTYFHTRKGQTEKSP